MVGCVFVVFIATTTTTNTTTTTTTTTTTVNRGPRRGSLLKEIKINSE